MKASRRFEQEDEALAVIDGLIQSRTDTLPAPVDLRNLELAEPHPHKIENYLPERVVTLFGGHGGTGKSFLALLLAVCAATGRPFLGKRCVLGRVLFYSCEDDAQTIRHRLRVICEAERIDPAELDGRLRVLDMTEHDPVLYRASRDGAGPTDVMDALREAVQGWPADVVIIDNGSDVFDANEIERARVREFIRGLRAMVRPHGGAVLLLAHVDKQTARNGGTEGYSGSTAWHNSVRSRLFLHKERDGLTLEHQKVNYGLPADPIRIFWCDGVPCALPAAAPDHARALLDATHLRSVLALILDFNERGEAISPHQTSPVNAYRALRGEQGYPQALTRTALFALIREAERQHLLERETFRTLDRKERERLVITPEGRALIGAPQVTPDPEPLDIEEGDA